VYKVSPKFTFAIDAVGIDRATQHPEWLSQIMAWDLHTLPLPLGPLGENLSAECQAFNQRWDDWQKGFSAEYLNWMWMLGIQAMQRLPELDGDGCRDGEVHPVPFDVVLRPSANLIIIGAERLDGYVDVDRVIQQLDALVNLQDGRGHD
jgi:hypothetical protein